MSSTTTPPDRGRLAVTELALGAAAEVVFEDAFNVIPDEAREPHRHGYHELIWVERGSGTHLIDGHEVPVEPHTVTVIGRGQVHVFLEARDIRGAVVRIRDELLVGGAEAITTGWLLAGTHERVVPVPVDACGALTGVLRSLHAELERPQDRYSPDVQRSLVATLLLWLERWYDASRSERRVADDAEVELHRRFVRRLEADFAAHHDAQHYADALAVPAPALRRTLVALTGRGTKEHVLERVMLEAQRLLRYTDATVGEIAWRVGFKDPLYFSRAFKRHAGVPPQAYRDAARGRAAAAADGGAP